MCIILTCILSKTLKFHRIIIDRETFSHFSLTIIIPDSMAVLGLVEVWTRRVKMTLRRKIISLLHLEGFKGVRQLIPLRRVQVEGVIRTETRTLSQPIGTLWL